MAEAMRRIVSDAKLAKKYQTASIEIAKKHDLKRTIARFEEIYKQAIILKRVGD